MSITNLNKPTVGSTGWGSDVNDNFTDVENLAKGTETAQALQVDNLKLDGNMLSSTDTNGNINVTPDGTGKVVLDGLSWPTADGTANQVIETDGSGNLSFDDAGGGDLVLISTATASNDATVEFTSGIDSTYKRYIVRMIDVKPANDQVAFRFRVSTDGGSTWKSGASDYAYVRFWGTGGFAGFSDTNADHISVAHPSLSNASGESYSCTMWFSSPASSSVYQVLSWNSFYLNHNSTLIRRQGSGFYKTAEAIDGFQYYMGSGNVSSGTFKLYGIK